MNRVPAALALSLAALAAPAPAAETWVVDASHTDVSFQIRHLMSKVRGSFGAVSGTILVDRAKPEASSVRFTIEVASIDTGNPKRDEHLRSADFFDAAKHPTITFESTKVVPRGPEAFDVTGNLAMHGVVKPLTLPVKVLGFQKDPRGNERVGFELSTTLLRKDFGIVYNQTLETGGLLLGEEVVVSIDVQAVRKDAPPTK